MSAKTRIKRPTTATPRKPVTSDRMLHQSTFLVQEKDPATGRRRLVMSAKPVTYRREA